MKEPETIQEMMTIFAEQAISELIDKEKIMDDFDEIDFACRSIASTNGCEYTDVARAASVVYQDTGDKEITIQSVRSWAMLKSNSKFTVEQMARMAVKSTAWKRLEAERAAKRPDEFPNP